MLPTPVNGMDDVQSAQFADSLWTKKASSLVRRKSTSFLSVLSRFLRTSGENCSSEVGEKSKADSKFLGRLALADLPFDVLLAIFTFLDVPDILSLAQVSNSCN